MAELVDAGLGPNMQVLRDGDLRYLLYMAPSDKGRVCIMKWDISDPKTSIQVGGGSVAFIE